MRNAVRSPAQRILLPCAQRTRQDLQIANACEVAVRLAATPRAGCGWAATSRSLAQLACGRAADQPARRSRRSGRVPAPTVAATAPCVARVDAVRGRGSAGVVPGGGLQLKAADTVRDTVRLFRVWFVGCTACKLKVSIVRFASYVL